MYNYIYANICVHICLYKYVYLYIRVQLSVNGLGNRGIIPGRVIPKTQKMVFDTSLFNTQYYNVRIKGKVQSSARSSALPNTSV